jgi:hypothetical protein
MKKQYIEPTITLVYVTGKSGMMAASVIPNTTVYNEVADENVTGLSRRQNRSVWDEEDEELEEVW